MQFTWSLRAFCMLFILNFLVRSFQHILINNVLNIYQSVCHLSELQKTDHILPHFINGCIENWILKSQVRCSALNHFFGFLPPGWNKKFCYVGLNKLFCLLMSYLFGVWKVEMMSKYSFVHKSYSALGYIFLRSAASIS